MSGKRTCWTQTCSGKFKELREEESWELQFHRSYGAFGAIVLLVLPRFAWVAWYVHHVWETGSLSVSSLVWTQGGKKYSIPFLMRTPQRGGHAVGSCRFWPVSCLACFMGTEEGCICGWRKSSFGSVREPSTRHHLVQACPGWQYQLFRELKRVSSLRVKFHLGEIPFLFNRVIWTFSLPISLKVFWPCQRVGERQMTHPFLKRRRKVSSETTDQWTWHWARKIFEMITHKKYLCPSEEEAPVKRLSHARFTLFLLWNVRSGKSRKCRRSRVSGPGKYVYQDSFTYKWQNSIHTGFLKWGTVLAPITDKFWGWSRKI